MFKCFTPAVLLFLFAVSLRAQVPSQADSHSGTALSQTDQVVSQTGQVHGVVVDESGAVVTDAQVNLVSIAGKNIAKTLTDSEGTYSFTNVAAGSFRLTVTAAGFAPESQTGSLLSGEIHAEPDITLEISSSSNIVVHATHEELAEQQIKADEQQRLIGFVPNFYVEYDHSAVSLTTKQKYELAWKSTFDWTSYPIIAGIAGVQQYNNSYSGFGQGGKGYAKRYGAAFATFAIGSELSDAVLPSVLKQDPRYFYKGSGSVMSRALYAFSMSVICRSDSGRWQPNYSAIAGNLAASGISNLYYPAANRNGAGLTFENAAIDTAIGGAENIFEEFFSKKFSKGLKK
jgi:hypothetical protein